MQPAANIKQSFEWIFPARKFYSLVMAEKMTNQIARPLREQWEKGKMALDRHNYEYAVAIFTQVLDKEPAFL